MARRVIEELVDDLDGGDATETVTFSYRGVDYEVDLSEKNAGKLDKVLGPYIAGARKVKQSRSSRAPAKTTSGPDPKAVREWAASHGIEVSDRGRVSAEVTRQYQDAHR